MDTVGQTRDWADDAAANFSFRIAPANGVLHAIVCQRGVTARAVNFSARSDFFCVRSDELITVTNDSTSSRVVLLSMPPSVCEQFIAEALAIVAQKPHTEMDAVGENFFVTRQKDDIFVASLDGERSFIVSFSVKNTRDIAIVKDLAVPVKATSGDLQLSAALDSVDTLLLRVWVKAHEESAQA